MDGRIATDSPVTTAQVVASSSQPGVAIGLVLVFLLAAFVGLLLWKSKRQREETSESSTIISHIPIDECVSEKAITLPRVKDNVDNERDAVVSFPIYTKIQTVKPAPDIPATINEPYEPYVIDLGSADKQRDADPANLLGSDAYEACEMGPYENTADLIESNHNPYELYEVTTSGQQHQVDPDHDRNDYSTIRDHIDNTTASDDYSIIEDDCS